MSKVQFWQIPKITGSALFFVAVLARLGSIGRYITPDELAWVQRSVNMRRALLTADWASTIQSGHPGVITTWLGAIGVQITLWLNPATQSDLNFVENIAWINPIYGEAHTHLAQFLTGGRIMVILTVSATIWLAYHLLARRFSPSAALTAGALLALDPWTIGLSNLLHVDALLAMFILLAILFAFPEGRLTSKHIALSGLFSALAFLNKLPGGILLGMIPLILLFNQVLRLQTQSFKEILPAFLKQLGLWVAVYLLTLSVFLPAVWAAPNQIWEIVIADGTRITGKRSPIFFLGSADFDIGLHFYPLAILIRQSPLVTLGLITGVWGIFSKTIKSEHKLFIAFLTLFCLLFWAGITLSSREFVRYALPISIILVVLSGLAWGSILNNQPTLGMGLLILQMVWMAWFWRYPLTTANLLTGGPWISFNQLALGWGDGVSQGAMWAAEQPGAMSKRLFTTNVPAAAPFFPGEVYLLEDQTISLIRPDDFIVLPLGLQQLEPNRWLTNSSAPLAEQFPAELVPQHTVQFNGLERAWVYSSVPAKLLHNNEIYSNSTDIRFGDSLFLNSSILTVPENKFRLVVQMAWGGTSDQDYSIVLTIEDGNNNLWLRHETPLISNAGLPSSSWESFGAQQTFAKLTYPADMPPGLYQLNAQIFDENGNRLGVYQTDGIFAGTQANLGSFASPAAAEQDLTKLNIENQGAFEPPFVGFTEFPTAVEQGEKINFSVWWEHPELFDPEKSVIAFRINPTGETGILSNFTWGDEDSRWVKGQIYKLNYSFDLGISYPPGEYEIELGYFNGQVNRYQSLTTLKLLPTNRLFELPDNLEELNLKYDPVARLHQFKPTFTDSNITLDLIWQTEQATNIDYTMFIHLKNRNGDIVGQLDRPPSKATSSWLENEVIIDQVILPLPNDEITAVAIGLYDPNTGQRLPVSGVDNQLLPNGQYELILDGG
ncbi:MAG: glycosyltransferase family 39 protein [Chloroflexota bacterium]